MFPTSLLELTVDLGSLSRYENGVPGGSRYLDMLVVRLNTCGCSLQRLEIKYQTRGFDSGTHLALGCKRHLPPLDELHVHLTSLEIPEDITWLATQPCSSLSLYVEVLEEDVAVQAREVAAIQQLPVARMLIAFEIAFSEESQRVWQQLSTPAYVQLWLQGETHAVYALPHAQHLCILVDAAVTEETLFNWAALADRAGCVHLEAVEEDYLLRLDNYPGHLPFEASGCPWQLEVHGQIELVGFPPSRKCKHAAYMLQNQAAMRAGWTENRLQSHFRGT